MLDTRLIEQKSVPLLRSGGGGRLRIIEQITVQRALIHCPPLREEKAMVLTPRQMLDGLRMSKGQPSHRCRATSGIC